MSHWYRFLACPLVIGCAVASAQTAPEGDLGLAVPEGFEASLYADDALAHNIFSMTVDAQGRVVVAGPDYVKILHDDDGDGRADRASLFSATPKSGAHGMYFDGPDLICTGDNAVRRLRDADGDGKADDEGEVWTHLRHSEHGANGVIKGPDGWFYVVCGNDAGISAEHAQRPGSPVKEPRCGGVGRISPDGREMDVMAHGFRNPYDLDFNATGQLFTVDADGERDHYLPWYAPTRLFDVATGMEHGWLLKGWQRSWNRPESFPDNVERLVEIGRGSPTGLTVYRHRQFPRYYRGGVFTACWTLGRVYFIGLVPKEASFTGELETFLQTTGDVGFAPVDLAVGHKGDLFVAVGGRGTRGSVFRVRYTPASVKTPDAPLEQVLAADQPLSSWSRAKWVPLARQLGREPFVAAMLDNQRDVCQQVRALEVLVELFGGLTDDEARKAVLLARPTLAARVAWALSRQPTEAVTTWLLAGMTYDNSPRVMRAAWEAIASLPRRIAAEVDRRPNWAGAADRNDCRRVRAAMLVAARNVGEESFHRVLGDPLKDNSPSRRLARLWLAERPADGKAMPDEYFDDCLNALNKSANPAVQIEALRLIQIGLGDLHIQPDQPEVYSGYMGNATLEIDRSTNSKFLSRLSRAIDGPAKSNASTKRVGEIEREVARVLAMISAAGTHTPEVVISYCTPDSSPVDDIHFLIVLSRLTGPRSEAVTLATARALVNLHRKMAARRMYPDTNWPLRVGEMYDELRHRDPRLARAVAESPGLGLPAHSLFAAHLRGDERQHAARRLLKVAQSVAPDDDNEPHWTPELVTVVASLADEECLPVLREQWNDFGLRDAIALALAARARPEDRARLVEALASPQGDVVSRAADALASLGTPATAAELAAALRTLKAYCAAPEQQPVRRALAKLLSVWSGENFEVPDPEGADLAAAYAMCFEWFAKTHPKESKTLAGFGGADAAAWGQRLAGVDWERGDRARGKLVFEKRSCNRCHTGGGRLGPDLAGAARRFSRDDLFASIVDPRRDVSPLYQTTLVATRAGQVHHGLLVYDSADGLLLQTGPDTTIRVTGDDLQSTRPSRQSLMPTGLLNDVNDKDLADLYVYLKELSK